MTGDPADEALMARTVGGDRTAYALLVERHGLRYRSLAYRFTGDMEQAEDMVQEAFIKLWTHAGGFDGARAKFTTWFHRIVVNRCLDEKRRRKPVQLADDFDQEDPGLSAEDRMVEADEQSMVRAAMLTLPDRQRTAIALSYFDGLSNGEAADVMDLKVKAYESLLVRARANLRQQLAGQRDQLLATD